MKKEQIKSINKMNQEERQEAYEQRILMREAAELEQEELWRKPGESEADYETRMRFL